MRPFQLTEAMVGDGCKEIAVEGELDMAVADRLQRAIATCESDRILIDLKDCEFIDSTGLAVILNANRSSGSQVALHSPRNQVRRILEVTGLTSNGLAFADREQALSALVSESAP